MIYGCFQKYWYPWFIMETLLKWMIWGYHYFWKHPYVHENYWCILMFWRCATGPYSVASTNAHDMRKYYTIQIFQFGWSHSGPYLHHESRWCNFQKVHKQKDPVNKIEVYRRVPSTFHRVYQDYPRTRWKRFLFLDWKLQTWCKDGTRYLDLFGDWQAWKFGWASVPCTYRFLFFYIKKNCRNRQKNILLWGLFLYL